MVRKVSLPLLGVLVLIGAGPRPSSGGTVTITTATTGYGRSVTIYDGTTKESGFAGRLAAKIDGKGAKLDTYCVDIAHYANPSETVLPVSIASLTDGRGAGVGFLFDTFDPKVTNADLGAGLQLAIWEYEYNGDHAINTTNSKLPFRLVSTTALKSAIADANADLAALQKAAKPTGSATWYEVADRGQHVKNDGGQSFVGPATPGIASATPEPASLTLLGLGCLGLLGRAGLRRRASA
ncbi:MAG TPA: PEP-CTERM sorting domain-containing protein [Isosphaeraceae bacterium]|jgi:hypothetical protein|nr:PEP-CTERM sorting domain-containing protein [Isosphaeraceae bacterium]